VTTFSTLRPAERIGPTAAERAGREAASTFLAIADCPPAGTSPDMIAWRVIQSYITPATAEDEGDAIVCAVLDQLSRRSA
jgi:plasmid stabilization system protein ParE